MERIFPDEQWERRKPGELGFSETKLEYAFRWLQSKAGDRRYRVVVIRNGFLVAEWQRGVTREQRIGIASAQKSIYSNMLGIAIAEGRIKSADDRAIEYFPEMMEVPEGQGPKPGRYAFEKDRDITLRQLISNTSGYMKPGEMPGKVFHYQSFGMSVFIHAIAKQYGLYDVNNPTTFLGFGKLVDEKICKKIRISFDYSIGNFDYPPGAKASVFGTWTGISSNAHDLARVGYLWLNNGKWRGDQVIPQDWLEQAVHVAPDILENCPEEEWKYGHGFWTNEYGQMWPDLPRDSYAALGGNSSQIVWVCPSLDLVVVESPSIWSSDDDSEGLRKLIVEACGQ